MAGWVLPAAMTVGAGALNSLFGSDDENMSPERRQLYDMLMSEYSLGEGGMSEYEKKLMRDKFEKFVEKKSASETESQLSSLGRRGLLSPGMAAPITNQIKSAGFMGATSAMGDIEQQSMTEARQHKDRLAQLLAGLSPEGDEKGADFSGMFGDIAGLISEYESNKKLFGGG